MVWINEVKKEGLMQWRMEDEGQASKTKTDNVQPAAEGQASGKEK